ncbi:MAG: MBL fold metallo-hydrolase [Candidatus Delongbacteria bacterium]|nr:MBL fold metallo-hydrolase [Candidatus Delongbacteria bacterium]MBN2833577.1 MBL fold metallo-hydrolase [Candidatus Delongbacteria bacterium]
MKIFILTIVVFILFSFIAILVSSCTKMGVKPDKKSISDLSFSDNYNIDKKQFQNRRPELVDDMRKRLMNFTSIMKFLFADKPDDTKPKNLPVIKPDFVDFMNTNDQIKAIWLGHSSFILNISGKVILVDPVFSTSASPVNFMVKRFIEPVAKLEDLPDVDVILISHDHYDHLDMEVVKFYKDKDNIFITPLGIGSYLKGWGITDDRIFETDWWGTVSYNGLNFVATPAQHFSGRGLSSNVTLWASWIIQKGKSKIFYSGDSGYDIHFKQIGNMFGPFDVAFIECGQYNEKWREVHMLPEESIMAFEDLNARKLFPVHWGMFELSSHSWNEPIMKVYEASIAKNFELVAPMIGEVVNLENTYEVTKWWEVPSLATEEELIIQR